MTTATQTAKMIYPSKAVANAILGKMRKRFPERKYAVVQLPTGYQVAGITKCPAYMPPAKPLPVNNATFASATSTELDALVLDFPYLRETKAWWYFTVDGKEHWLHKNHPISAEIVTHHTGGPDTLRLKVSAKLAQEKGLIQQTEQETA